MMTECGLGGGGGGGGVEASIIISRVAVWGLTTASVCLPARVTHLLMVALDMSCAGQIGETGETGDTTSLPTDQLNIIAQLDSDAKPWLGFHVELPEYRAGCGWSCSWTGAELLTFTVQTPDCRGSWSENIFLPISDSTSTCPWPPLYLWFIVKPIVIH